MGDPPSSPLLMHVFDEYVTMPKKIMFVGQETHGWCETISQKYPLDYLLRAYEGFELGKRTDYGDGKIRHLRSPFWNFSRSFFHQMNSADPSVHRSVNGFFWTNISKFDKATTTPSQELQDQNPEGFLLLKDEIAITKPDVVVFLTGEKYNVKIDEVFKTKRESLMENELMYSLKTTDGSLPVAFQTKHPRTLCQQKVYRKVLDELVTSAKFSLID